MRILPEIFHETVLLRIGVNIIYQPTAIIFAVDGDAAKGFFK